MLLRELTFNSVLKERSGMVGRLCYFCAIFQAHDDKYKIHNPDSVYNVLLC